MHKIAEAYFIDQNTLNQVYVAQMFINSSFLNQYVNCIYFDQIFNLIILPGHPHLFIYLISNIPFILFLNLNITLSPHAESKTEVQSLDYSAWVDNTTSIVFHYEHSKQNNKWKVASYSKKTTHFQLRFNV